MSAPNQADTRTRQRVLEAAIALLSTQGLSGTLLCDAALLAGCSLERAHILFKRDEDLVLALYSRLAVDLEARVANLPDADVAERFRQIMLAKLALVAPHREALTALLATLLDPRHELGALSPQTEIVRNRVMGVFAAVVLGAKNAPAKEAEAMTRTLYGLHLAIMLLWTQDRTEDSKSTRAAIDLVSNLLSLTNKLSWLPNYKGSFAKFDEIAAPLVEPSPDESLNERAIEILRLLFRHRRLQPDSGSCATDPCRQ